MLFEGNLAWLEDLYRAWRENPAAVEPSWIPWLEELETGRAAEPPAPQQVRGAAATEDVLAYHC